MKSKVIILIITFLLIPTVLSFGPHTHNQLNTELLNEASSPITKLCSENLVNRQAFLLGVVAPDITVIFYYTNNGENYRLTHNWNFQQKLMAEAIKDNEKCFAWGVGAHLIQDSISHTQAVPLAIEEEGVKNWMLHPLLEKRYDSELVSRNPKLLDSTPRMMDALSSPEGDRYVEMIENALGEDSSVNVRETLNQLRIALGSFYETQYQKPGTATGDTWIFEAYNSIDKFTNFINPYIGAVSSGNMDYYYKKSKRETDSVFNNWGARYQISPHGFTELKAADNKTGNTLMYWLIGLAVIPVVVTLFRKNTLYLLLIPLLWILYIVIVYAGL